MTSVAFSVLPHAIMAGIVCLPATGGKIWAQEKKGLIYVANEGSASISIIDSVAMKQPHGVAAQ